MHDCRCRYRDVRTYVVNLAQLLYAAPISADIHIHTYVRTYMLRVSVAAHAHPTCGRAEGTKTGMHSTGGIKPMRACRDQMLPRWTGQASHWLKPDGGQQYAPNNSIRMHYVCTHVRYIGIAQQYGPHHNEQHTQHPSVHIRILSNLGWWDTGHPNVCLAGCWIRWGNLLTNFHAWYRDIKQHDIRFSYCNWMVLNECCGIGCYVHAWATEQCKEPVHVRMYVYTRICTYLHIHIAIRTYIHTYSLLRYQ